MQNLCVHFKLLICVQFSFSVATTSKTDVKLNLLSIEEKLDILNTEDAT